MRIRAFLFTIFLTISSMAAEPLPSVVLLGDSIRKNYQGEVVKALTDKATISSPKDNCRHTEFVLENLERWLAEHKMADVIHINVGLHDLYLDAKTGRPRHSLDIYEKNLRAIFGKLSELSDATVIFALTTVVDEKQQADSKGYKRVVRRNSDIEIYNEKARAVAKELGVAVNDLNGFMKKVGPEKILNPSDGIHLSPEGCKLMGGEVARVTMERLGKEN